MSNQGARGRDWLMRLAGFGTVILVGAVLMPRGPGYLGIPAAWLGYGGVTAFLLFMAISDLARTDAQRMLVVLGQAIAALTAISVSPGSSTPILVIVLVAQLAFMFRMPRVVPIVLALNLALYLIMVGAWGAGYRNALLSVLLFGSFQLFALLVAAYAQAADDARQSLQEVNAELLATRSLLVESARDRERLRLSRELHDVAGHTLTALKLNLRRLQQVTEGEARTSATESLELADSLLEDVRALIGNFRRTDGVSIDGAIRELTAAFDAPTFELALEEAAAVPDLETARVLVAVAREAITNVVRHAQARVCRIRLARSEDGFQLEVEDDGRGIGSAVPGQGMRGMRERLEAVGGLLEVGRSAIGGTRVQATVGASA